MSDKPKAPWDKVKARKSNVIQMKLAKGEKVGTPGYRGTGPTVTEDKPLTAKQSEFVKNMLIGMSGAEAYRRSYNASKMGPTAQSSEAAKLLGHPSISKALDIGFADKQRKAKHTAATLRQFVTDGLFKEASEAGTDAARIRAYELLGKIDYVGLFKERIGNEDDQRSAEEIKAELEQRLKQAFDRVS